MKKLFYFSILIFIAAPVLLTAQDKPLLSEAIQKEIETNGVEFAKKHFAELYESQKNFYNVDMNGISALANSYVKNNKIQEAGAVMEIATPFMQYVILANTNTDSYETLKRLDEEKRIKKEKQKKEREKEQSIQKTRVTDILGESRNDLKRFVGLYGDPEEENQYRRLWVMVSCDGYLVSGVLWGDTSPWWMKSEGDNIFTYSDSFNNVRMEFETDNNGKALRMVHNQSYIKTPLERLGPVPEDWGSCVEPPDREQHR